SNFNNENDPWEFGLDIDDFDLHLTLVLRSSSSTRVEPSPLTPNPVRIIPGHAGIVQLSSSTRVEPSPPTSNPVRIIPGPAGIVQQAKMLKEKVFILDSDGALMSTQEYMQKVVEDVGQDDDFMSGSWVSATNYVTVNGGTVTGCTIHEAIHYKVIGDGGYGKDITVGAAMILANINNMPRNNLSLEPPTSAVSGISRYLTRLWVSGKGELPEELSRSESSQSSIPGGFELRADNIDPHDKIIQDNIRAALKLLTFREQNVLVQFWSPRVVGKHHQLTTEDQPYGLGAIDDRLYMYRKDSERNVYVVDKDYEEEENTSPPARVFRQRLPEWTADITNYKPKDFPQQECAISCDLRGYLALPVFDSTTGLCVGVIELLASSKYTSFAYEVHQFQRALKSVNLTTKHAQDSPTLNVHNEHRDNDLEKIFSILKVVCETHRLPLAQTWAMSPLSSFTPHEQMLKKSCNSFNTRCLGKSCMSTAALPFYVQDLGLWRFREACREQHLDKSRGSVGKALLSHGSSFCEDVTKLSKEEYPLGSYAQMSGLTSCFAIFLHSVESNDGYVIEFFLSLNIEDVRYVQNLVQTLKENTEMASGIVLGDKSPTQVVGPPTESTSLYLDRDPQSTIITATTTRKNKTLEMVSSDSESHVAVEAKTNSTQDMNQLSPKQDTFTNNNDGAITSTEIVVQEAVTTDIINAVTRDIINAVDGRDYDNPSDNNTKSLLKNDIITDVEEKSKPVKRGRKRKIDNLTMEAVRKHLGKPIDEAAKSLEGNRSTLKRFCRDNNMPSWPLPKHNKKTVHVTDSKLSQSSQSSNIRFSLFSVVFLLVRVKRWSCSSKHHGLSGKWWVCGKHCYFPSKSDSIYQVARLMVYLNRWKNKKSTKYHLAVCESTEKPEQPDVDLKLPESSLVYASSKQIVVGAVSDAAKVTVKATFKDDIIKFPISTSSGLVELEKEVAQRITLKSKKLCLKYRDEDDDLILLACDADLQYLLGYSASNNSTTIKIIIMLVDE
ncbi:NIN-like protein, partial [Tanacetum coccineum]